jgi:hypothetical protein
MHAIVSEEISLGNGQLMHSHQHKFLLMLMILLTMAYPDGTCVKSFFSEHNVVIFGGELY